jgi:hypothetical protein
MTIQEIAQGWKKVLFCAAIPLEKAGGGRAIVIVFLISCVQG